MSQLSLSLSPKHLPPVDSIWRIGDEIVSGKRGPSSSLYFSETGKIIAAGQRLGQD